MQRILVVAMSGAGKTTAARRLADHLGLPFHELDALAIGPGWSRPPTFEHDVGAIVAGPRWVIDSWGPPEVRDVMWAAADTVVWLDYPRRVVLPRLTMRSWRRSATREPLFGGNVETWRAWLGSDHPVWHAVSTFSRRRAYLARRTAGEAHLRTIRLRSPRELETWLRGLPRS